MRRERASRLPTPRQSGKRAPRGQSVAEPRKRELFLPFATARAAKAGIWNTKCILRSEGKLGFPPSCRCMLGTHEERPKMMKTL